MVKLWWFGVRLGLVPSVLCSFGWVVCGAVVVRAVADSLGRHPQLGMAAVGVVAATVALGALVGFWIIAAHVDFWRCGYRVRSVMPSGDRWIYEERGQGVQFRSFEFARVARGGGYPVSCTVRVPGEARWKAEMPQWASTRREEILNRIAHAFGGDDVGGDVSFEDS